MCVFFCLQYEYAVVPEAFSKEEIAGTHYKTSAGVVPVNGGGAMNPTMIEHRPHFYEWATATTGMIAVTRRMRSTFRNYVAAETACPTVVCAACRGPLDEVDFQFAGVVRSNSKRPKTHTAHTCARIRSFILLCGVGIIRLVQVSELWTMASGPKTTSISPWPLGGWRLSSTTPPPSFTRVSEPPLPPLHTPQLCRLLC